MMTTRLPISIRQLDRLDTAVLTVDNRNYGSTNLDELQLLKSALAEATDVTNSSTVILDLSAVEVTGSSFLTCLDSLEKLLRNANRTLVVCGDRNELVKLVNWTGRMNYQSDLEAALNWSALQRI